jgi:hypothetical protein
VRKANRIRRMYFIRNIEALKDKDVESQAFEFEVITDADIVGKSTYGPYHFTIWEISNKHGGEERKLCFRIRERAFSNDDQPWESAKRSGFYHGGGIADELVALASLFLRRRFKHGSIVRMNDRPILLSRSKRWIDRPLVAGQSNLAELPEWLKLVEALDSNYHQRFILAVRLYHRALLLIEEQPDIAYLNLVSAIEVLCHDADIGEVTLSDLDLKIAKLVGSVENKDLRNNIEQTILKREQFIRRRFVTFILNHIEDDFWTGEERPKQGRIKPEELPDLLKRIYDQRSRTLHDGEPFPPSVFAPPLMGAEIDFSLGMTVGEKKWEPKDFIPHPYFFERLVNHVLKTFLKRNQLK